jgi:hypothetical protein
MRPADYFESALHDLKASFAGNLEATARIFVNFILAQAVLLAKRHFPPDHVRGLAIVPEQVLPECHVQGLGIISGVTDFVSMRLESMSDESTTSWIVPRLTWA